MKILGQTSLKVNSDLQSLTQVLAVFDSLNQDWIPRKDWLKSQLALTEGFTNAVRHAHHHLPTEVPIEVQMTLTSQSLIIQIWDQGSYFDLENFLQAREGQDHQFEDHRQGLPILQKIAAKLSYTRQEDNRNCLLIIKQFTTD
jgi:serine/threonine-protein kinase RsbW